MVLQDLIPALFDNYFIKIIFLVHATLVSLATIGFYHSETTLAYLGYNSLFLILILLACNEKCSADSLLLASAFNIICMGLDVLTLVYHTQNPIIPILVVVINLVLRPISSIMLLRNYSARAGVEDPTSGLLQVPSPTVSGSRTAYQNIDEPSQTLP